jgi:putative ABC transport system permease protein
MLVVAARVAFHALLRHRMRTGLTALSIGVGIAAVMATVALGQAGTARVEAQLDALGQDFIWLRPGSANTGGVRSGFGSRRSLTVGDWQDLSTQIPEISSCSPVINGREQMIVAGRNWNTRFIGVSPDYFMIRRWSMDMGTPLSPYEIDSRARVVILGATVARELFPTENPVGHTVRYGLFPFRVIGVMRPRGADRSGLNQDDVVVMPWTTAQRTIEGQHWVDEIICGTRTPESTAVAEARAVSLLRLRHKLDPEEPNDFNLRRPQDALMLRLSAMESLAFLLASVAVISLVVGGVGIMNIMLVSVTERRQEIGLRMALGAREVDIRLQFLVEAVLLGVAGSALGIALGTTAARLMTEWFGWHTLFSTELAGVAVLFAIAVGLVFGYLPASKASGLTPLDALRTE